MLKNRIIKISFTKGGDLRVNYAGRRWKIFEEVSEALGFVCGLREDDRDQSCILLPPNALTDLLLHPRVISWNEGMAKAKALKGVKK